MERDPYYVDFGSRVREARASRTQQDLASSARMTRVAIANIEGGRHRVTIDVLDRLARALNVPAATLLPAISSDVDEVDAAAASLKPSEREALARVRLAGMRQRDAAR